MISVQYNVNVAMATGQDGRSVCAVGVREVASSYKILVKKSEGGKTFGKITAELGE